MPLRHRRRSPNHPTMLEDDYRPDIIVLDDIDEPTPVSNIDFDGALRSAVKPWATGRTNEQR